MRPTAVRNRLALMAFGALLIASMSVGVGAGVGINHDTTQIIQEAGK